MTTSNWNPKRQRPLQSSSDRLIREPECKEITALSRQYRWELEKAGKFPKRIKLGTKAIAWRYNDIQEWIKNGKSV